MEDLMGYLLCGWIASIFPLITALTFSSDAKRIYARKGDSNVARASARDALIMYGVFFAFIVGLWLPIVLLALVGVVCFGAWSAVTGLWAVVRIYLGRKY